MRTAHAVTTVTRAPCAPYETRRIVPALLLAAFAVTAHAQEYPGKAARIIVGYPPGGANDLIARIVAQKRSEQWPSQFIVENRPGASAVIGTEVVARATPGGLTHMVLELFKSTAGVQIQSVVYKGASPAHTDALAGHVQGMIEALPALFPTVKQGKLRPIAVTSRERNSLLPEVGTAVEQGVPGLLAVNWFGVVAPARVPRAVVDKLHGALTRIPAQADVKARFTALGLEGMTSATPEAYAAMIRSDVVYWSKVAAVAGVKPQ